MAGTMTLPVKYFCGHKASKNSSQVLGLQTSPTKVTCMCLQTVLLLKQNEAVEFLFLGADIQDCSLWHKDNKRVAVLSQHPTTTITPTTVPKVAPRQPPPIVGNSSAEVCIKALVSIVYTFV
uniref:Uncharacterized protein n=1 Tax=Eutreptiella gymnastica TaxID=73025 RepID=A0A7S1IIK2_9EUGL|mmetsp:Transcript_19964/g.35584  ORF Transcript_19964/g.35584 Transcript_19964/m.35584 type:complete len:122 (+) Transcript_19964:105-470(+)